MKINLGYTGEAEAVGLNKSAWKLIQNKNTHSTGSTYKTYIIVRNFFYWSTQLRPDSTRVTGYHWYQSSSSTDIVPVLGSPSPCPSHFTNELVSKARKKPKVLIFQFQRNANEIMYCLHRWIVRVFHFYSQHQRQLSKLLHISSHKMLKLLKIDVISLKLLRSPYMKCIVNWLI